LVWAHLHGPLQARTIAADYVVQYFKDIQVCVCVCLHLCLVAYRLSN